MQRMLQAITTEHQAASWAVSAESSFTNRRDTDVVTHHHRTGIEKGLDRVDFFYSRCIFVHIIPTSRTVLIRGTCDGLVYYIFFDSWDNQMKNNRLACVLTACTVSVATALGLFSSMKVNQQALLCSTLLPRR